MGMGYLQNPIRIPLRVVHRFKPGLANSAWVSILYSGSMAEYCHRSCLLTELKLVINLQLAKTYSKGRDPMPE